MPMQQLAAAQTSAEVPINENFDTLSHASTYGKRQPTTVGLTWGYYGGNWGGFTVADGTLTLANTTVNYIVVNRATGAISVSSSSANWNDAGNYARVYQLTTAGGVVTAAADFRCGPQGVHGQMPPPPAVSIASAATIAVPIGVQVATVTGTTGITSITATGHSGNRVTLIFAGALTVTDGGNLKLQGNFVSTADDTLTLVCDGANWFEVARSPN